MFALSLLATGLSIQFIIHRPQAAAPLAPLSPPIPHHPLSVKADCFHANRVLGASTLSHYIRQREERERKKRGTRESALWTHPTALGSRSLYVQLTKHRG